MRQQKMRQQKIGQQKVEEQKVGQRGWNFRSKRKNSWEVSRSCRQGFQQNYFTMTTQGHQLDIDFNSLSYTVRLSFRPANESGFEYIALIKNGTILREQEALSRRSIDLTSRIYPLLPVLRSLPNRSVLRAIGNNFGIHLPTERQEHWHIRANKIEKRGSIINLKYLGQYLQRRRVEEQRYRSFSQQLLRRLPAEGFDISLGLLACWAFFQGFLNVVEAASLLGFLGIFLGGIDWIWRQRSPFIPKVCLFMFSCALLLYLQVQSRIWAGIP